MDTQIDRCTDRQTHRHTDRQTDTTRNITYLHTRVVITSPVAKLRYHSGVPLRDTTVVYHPTMTYFVAGPHRLKKMSSKQFSNYQLRLHNYYMYDFTLAAKPRIDRRKSETGAMILLAIFTTRKRSRGKVMFSQLSVSHSVHGGSSMSPVMTSRCH